MRTAVWVCLAYGVAMRLGELALSRRNRRAVLDRGGHAIARDGMAAITAVHVAWFAGMAAEEWLVGPSYRLPALQVACAVLFVAAEAMRFWCIATLGSRWNVRVVVLPGAPLVRTGPYRFLRHPNYVAVVAGLAALPLALGLPFTAAAVVPAKLLALRGRIRAEEAAMAGILSPGGGEP